MYPISWNYLVENKSMNNCKSDNIGLFFSKLSTHLNYLKEKSTPIF